MGRLTRDAYARLVDEDLVWLDSLPHSLERDHVAAVVRASVELYYPRAVRLYLDDVRSPPDDGRGPWCVARTADQAREILLSGPVEEASLDHDLGQCATCADGGRDTCPHAETGYDLVLWMARTGRWPRTKPRVHSANPVGASAMRQAVDRYWCAPSERPAPGRAERG